MKTLLPFQTIYNVKERTQQSTINSKKYGVNLIRFTHANDKVIHSSTKVDDAIRYLNLGTNMFLHYFTGHKDKVASLCVSPVDDTFLSGSLDHSLRKWDLRTQKCVTELELTGTPLVAYDPEGIVFAAGINNAFVKLYDVRKCKLPFATFQINKKRDCDWVGLKFSPDGKTILINTNGPIMPLVDAFKGNLLQKLTGHLNDMEVPIEASFTPDSKFVVSGSTDGKVHVWNADAGYRVCAIRGDHNGAVQCVRWNPKYFMVASACTTMCFWMPYRN